MSAPEREIVTTSVSIAVRGTITRIIAPGLATNMERIAFVFPEPVGALIIKSSPFRNVSKACACQSLRCTPRVL